MIIKNRYRIISKIGKLNRIKFKIKFFFHECSITSFKNCVCMKNSRLKLDFKKKEFK